MLNGSASSDPDPGDAISFSWAQIAGPAVTLSSATSDKPTFTAPTVTATTVLTFQLTVTDTGGLSASDSVNVTVNPTGGADTTPPSAPTNLAGTALAGAKVKLTWNVSTDNVAVKGYRVYRAKGSGAFSKIAGVTGIAFTDSGLTAGVSYRYKVTAIDTSNNESASSNIVSVKARL